MLPVAIYLPQPLYRRLERLAELTRQPVERIVARTLTSTLPPLPDDLPSTMRDVLMDLEALDDEQLWQVVHATASLEQQEHLAALHERQQNGEATEDEQGALTALHQEIDALMLRKAYAAVLLKWRGHRLPSLAELEATT